MTQAFFFSNASTMHNYDAYKWYIKGIPWKYYSHDKLQMHIFLVFYKKLMKTVIKYLLAFKALRSNKITFITNEVTNKL